MKVPQLYAEKGAVSENFPERAHKRERGGKAESHKQTVKRRIAHLVVTRKGLRASENNAVDDNQRQKYSQRIVQIRHKFFENHLYDGDECGDNQDESRNTHLVGYYFPQKRNEHVAAY